MSIPRNSRNCIGLLLSGLFYRPMTAMREDWTWRRYQPAPRMSAALLSLKFSRPQSRRCHMDARRWKRRRFVQSLRRAG